MPTFADLYRARASTLALQDENFLVAATGFLINTVPAAAAVFMKTFEEAEASNVWCTGQEGLFHFENGSSVGRTDLTLRWLESGALRTMVVEAKLDSPVDQEQLKKYANAVGPAGRVVLLAREVPAYLPLNVKAYTWSQLGSRLLSVADDNTPGGALTRQWLDFAQDKDVVCSARIKLDEGSKATKDAAALEEVDASLKQLLPYIVPSPSRQALPPLLRDGESDDDVGWYSEWEGSESLKNGKLAFRGLGIAATADPLGGLAWRCDVLPRTKVIRDALLGAKNLPWRKSGIGDWLRAGVADTGPQMPLSEAVTKAIRGCRAVLRTPVGLTDATGLWSGTADGSFPVSPDSRTVADIATLVVSARRIRGADDVLTRRFLSQLRTRVVSAGVPCRAVYGRGGSFYAEDGSFQMGAWIELGSAERPVVVWIWSAARARADHLVDQALDGWTIYREDRPNSVYAAPKPPDVLDASLVDALAAEIVPVLMR